MNPSDFLLLILSLGFAILSLLVHGFTPNGVGPALFAAAGGLWQLGMQWQRHRSWLRHRDSDFIPGTQHLAIAAWLGWSLGTFVALTWAWLAIRGLRIEGQP